MKDEERVTARALVWAERKIYGRMYGDENRLEALLKEAGFERGTMRAIGKAHGCCALSKTIVLSRRT
jgi:hypothetical protein